MFILTYVSNRDVLFLYNMIYRVNVVQNYNTRNRPQNNNNFPTEMDWYSFLHEELLFCLYISKNEAHYTAIINSRYYLFHSISDTLLMRYLAV